MLAGPRNLDAAHVMSTALDQLLDVARHAPDVVFVKPVLRDEDVQLIEARLFAELDEGCEIDIAVDDVLHARLRLAHVVNTAADHEWCLDAIRSLDCDGVADVCPRDLKRIALDQYRAVCRRPSVALRHELADANVAEIFDYKQNQVAPLHWTSLNLAADRAARFCITHFRILQNRFDEIVIDRVDAQHCRGGVRLQVSAIELAREYRV